LYCGPKVRESEEAFLEDVELFDANTNEKVEYGYTVLPPDTTTK